jgi:hypothetical protein
MPFYKDHVYPYLVSLLGNPKPIDDIRRASSRWRKRMSLRSAGVLT